MKALFLLFLIGCASASFYDDLEDAADEIYNDFMENVEMDPYMADEIEVTTDLGKRLRDALDHILEKIKDAIDNGKVVREDLQEKLQEIRQKLKDIRVDIGSKSKELIERIREKSKEWVKNLLERLGVHEKRSIGNDVAYIEFNLKELFNKLKKAILDKVDKESLKEKIEQLFGKGSEMADALLKIINEKGDKYKQRILDLIDRYLGKEKRSISEYWEKVKNYFKDLHIDLQEKYAKFGEWVKEKMSKVLDKSKSKIENIKDIAREFIDHAKDLKKEIAVEGLNFLKPYKEDLGSLYDQVKDTVKDILNRKD